LNLIGKVKAPTRGKLKGLSDGAADIGGGLSLTTGF
jgi:hypothetical protein